LNHRAEEGRGGKKEGGPKKKKSDVSPCALGKKARSRRRKRKEQREFLTLIDCIPQSEGGMSCEKKKIKRRVGATIALKKESKLKGEREKRGKAAGRRVEGPG